MLAAREMYLTYTQDRYRHASKTQLYAPPVTTSVPAVNPRLVLHATSAVLFDGRREVVGRVDRNTGRWIAGMDRYRTSPPLF